jgi:hypothetical protein
MCSIPVVKWCVCGCSFTLAENRPNFTLQKVQEGPYVGGGASSTTRVGTRETKSGKTSR